MKTCSVCNKVFKNGRGLCGHNSVVHSKTECEMCHRFIPAPKKQVHLNAHLFGRLGKNEFKKALLNGFCEKCGKICDGKYASGRFCSRQCANSRNLSREIYREIGLKLTKIDYSLKNCPSCGKLFFPKSKGQKQLYCSRSCASREMLRSEEHRKKMTIAAKGKCGGYRRGSGNGLRGSYKGFWCDSSWELAFVIYNLEHDVDIKRNKDFYYYELDGVKRKYYPDFLIDDVFYEIKGYHFPEATKAKIKHFPHKIILIGKREIKLYLEYIEQKYGKDFVKLYDSHTGIVKENAECQSV